VTQFSVAAESLELLISVVTFLEEQQIDCLLIGGFALSAYGYVRATRDTGALLHVPVQQKESLATLLKNAGFQVELRVGDYEDPIPFVIAVHTSSGAQVDLLGGLRGMDAGAFRRARRFTVLGRPVNFVGPEDFIAMKCYAGSAQDLLDVREMLRLVRSTLDESLLLELGRKFGRRASHHLTALLAAETSP
jgi:hypothetical protein